MIDGVTDENGDLAEGDGETQRAHRLSPGGQLLERGEEGDDAVLGDGLKENDALDSTIKLLNFTGESQRINYLSDRDSI